MTGAVRALATPDHALILLLGTGFDEFPDPDFSRRRLIETGTDIVYVRSVSTSFHEAEVTVQAWDADPGLDDAADWEARDEDEMDFTGGGVYVSILAERALTPVLPIGPAGRYHVRAEAVGRERLLDLDASPDRPDRLVGIERFRLRFWARTR